jgi:hypothetical protein
MLGEAARKFASPLKKAGFWAQAPFKFRVRKGAKDIFCWHLDVLFLATYILSVKANSIIAGGTRRASIKVRKGELPTRARTCECAKIRGESVSEILRGDGQRGEILGTRAAIWRLQFLGFFKSFPFNDPTLSDSAFDQVSLKLQQIGKLDALTAICSTPCCTETKTHASADLLQPVRTHQRRSS